MGKDPLVSVSQDQLVARDARLGPEVGSVVAARRLVSDAASAWRRSDRVTHDAALTISELVSNAVLHAGTDIAVSVRPSGSGIRVEVHDGSEGMPAVPPDRPEDVLAGWSMTGRGLTLVAALADRWGVDPRPGGGKVMWAEVGTGATGLSDRSPVDDPPHRTAGRTVRLIDVPVRLLIESAGQFGDLLREVQVITLDPAEPDAGPGLTETSRQLALGMGSLSEHGRRAAERALRRGDQTADVEVTVSDEALGSFRHLGDLLHRLRTAVARLPLLTLPASDEVDGYRAWCADEVARQLGGADPAPCPFSPTPPEPPGPVGEAPVG